MSNNKLTFQEMAQINQLTTMEKKFKSSKLNI
jgi:hypothetical protein